MFKKLEFVGASRYNFFLFRVPDVVVLKKHVLVMSFIGRDGQPAPKLKFAVEKMSKSQVETAYKQVEEMMVNLLIYNNLLQFFYQEIMLLGKIAKLVSYIY